MRSTVTTTLATAAIAIAALAGCSAGDDAASSPSDAKPTSTSASATPSTDASAATLKTAETSVGTVITDGSGRVVYTFDKDMAGATSSACADDCAAMWPAVPGDTAELDGVKGEVGTITGTDGKPQLTLNGHPLYYFAKDAAAGDAKGQGVKGVWWVLDAQGAQIKG